jgi:DNA-binding transcriptional LysR family regulator
VLDLGSVSGAADVLGYTQSAVSQQLAALERAVGFALVDRTQRPLRPTSEAAVLRPHVDRVLAALSAADGVVEDLRGGVTRLRLAAFPSALSTFVPAAVRDMRRDRGDVVVQVLQLETHEAIERLQAGGADLAVVHHLPGITAPEVGGMRRRSLLVDELCVVLPAGHRLARRDKVAVADLQNEPLVLPRRDTPASRFRAVVERLCAQAGFAPRVAYELDDLPAVQAFIAAGTAVALMHGLTLATVPSGVTVRPLAEHPAGSRTVEAVMPQTTRSSLADDLLERLHSAARAYATAP